MWTALLCVCFYGRFGHQCCTFMHCGTAAACSLHRFVHTFCTSALSCIICMIMACMLACCCRGNQGISCTSDVVTEVDLGVSTLLGGPLPLAMAGVTTLQVSVQ